MAEILWVNPVGTGDFDADTVELIEAVRSARHEPRVRHLEEGPPHLEYHLYEHEALTPMLALMREAEEDGCGAGVIGCFYDGGLRELREALRMPVVGMAEASLLLASTLGHRFTIIVGRRKWIPKMSDNVVLYGLDRRLASFRSVEMGIPEVLEDPDGFFDRVLEEGRRAVSEDGAEVIVLSEIASPAFWERARAELPVPLVDPGVACWKWAELVADLYLELGLAHSKVYGYEAPPSARSLR
jgi:Asp/Glu/hydantoin racemase